MNSRTLTTIPAHLRYLCGPSVSSVVKSRAARVASITTCASLSPTSHPFQFSIFHFLFSLFLTRHSSLAIRHFFHPLEVHP